MMTHDKLVCISGKWLKKHSQNARIPNCRLVRTELKTVIDEIPDVIGWCSSCSIMIEVKVSRSDFLKDAKKPFRTKSESGIGEYRYYCCPQGLIRPHDIPEKWGLLWYNGSNELEIVKDAIAQNANVINERAILLSIIRRSKIK